MPDRMKLTAVQIQWLNDPRPYFRRHKDRTGEALIRKGVVVKYTGNYRVSYELTPAGRVLLASNAKGE